MQLPSIIYDYVGLLFLTERILVELISKALHFNLFLGFYKYK